MSYYDERVQSRPVNNDKIQELHATLKSYRNEGFGQKHKPWTPEVCLILGKIYYEAWETMPISRRMEFIYGLPNNKTIKRLFGSFEAFYEQIRLATNAVQEDEKSLDVS